MNIIINTLILIVVIIFLIMTRHLYIRNQRLKNKDQLNMIFTSITHELLTPLTIISASVENLREREPGYKKEFDLMDLNIQRSVRLLQQILEASKASDGRLKLLVAKGDVMSYIRETARCIIPLVMKKGIQFDVRCNPKSMIGWIDTDKIDKIIFNLLSNAVKFSDKTNARILLDVSTNNYYDEVIIVVEDNGCGIPKNRQNNIFETFYDGEYRRFKVIGNGIGLSLTRDLVRLNGGTITFESKENIGTKFIVKLPIGKEAFTPEQIDESNIVNIDNVQNAIFDFPYSTTDTFNAEPTNQETDDDKYRLLLVEDNTELLMLMKLLLSAKYKIFTASNGIEAINVIQTTEIDIIVSDVMMPEMDGWELTNKVKSDSEYSHLPIILLTARTQEEDRKKSLLVGADDYVCKPFKIGDLQLRIENIVTNSRRIQSEFSSKSMEESEEEQITSPEQELVAKAIECVKRNISDSEYDRNSFAADMGMSSSSLYNKLRATTGMSVSSFIRDIRMKEACKLAKKNPSIRISELAYLVGYKDPKYFATSFKKEMGMQPSEYIEKLFSSNAKEPKS